MEQIVCQNWLISPWGEGTLLFPMKYASVCFYHLFGILMVVCVFLHYFYHLFRRSRIFFLHRKPATSWNLIWMEKVFELKTHIFSSDFNRCHWQEKLFWNERKEILMLNIEMTIIYYGKIKFLLCIENIMAQTQDKNQHRRALWKTMPAFVTLTPPLLPKFLLCIFMSEVPFTYFIHTIHTRKGLIILGNLYLVIGSSSEWNSSVQIEKNSTLCFISVPWIRIHVWLLFSPFLESKTARLLWWLNGGI